MLQKWAGAEKLRQRILTYGREVSDRYGMGGSVPAVLWIDPAGTVVHAESGQTGRLHLDYHTKRLLRHSGPQRSAM